MFVPLWGLIVGGLLSLVGGVTILIHCAPLVAAILEGLGDAFD